MSEEGLPRAALNWLERAERELRRASATDIDEILNGLRSHIAEALERGEPINDVLTRLGSAEDIASPPSGAEPSPHTREQVEDPTAPSRPSTRSPGYFTIKRNAQFAAFVLALVAAAWISLLPGYTESTIDPVTGQVVDTTTHIALFTMDPKVGGAMAVAILLTAAPLPIREVALQRVMVFTAAAIVALTVVTVGWIVGWFILPSAVAAVAATILPDVPRRRRRRPETLAGV